MNNKEKLYLAKQAGHPGKFRRPPGSLDLGRFNSPLERRNEMQSNFLQNIVGTKPTIREQLQAGPPGGAGAAAGAAAVAPANPTSPQFAPEVEAKPAPQTTTGNAHPTADKPFYPGGVSYPWMEKNTPAVTKFTNSWIKGKPVADLLKPFKPLGKAIGTVGTGLQSATNMASKMFNNK